MVTLAMMGCWAKTKDIKTVERFSLITASGYLNVVIFPGKFHGLYARLDRPHSAISPGSIWISYSPDLKYWVESKLIMNPMQYHWDQMKLDPGAPPIKTSRARISIYHGVFSTRNGSVHRLGVILHDLKDLSKIIAVGDEWILLPEDDGSLKIYWGGADEVMCVGTIRLDDLADYCLKNSRNPM